MASAPRQTLAGVENEQLAQSALPRIPARHCPVGNGTQLSGLHFYSLRLPTRGCVAIFGKVHGAAVFSSSVVPLYGTESLSAYKLSPLSKIEVVLLKKKITRKM